MNPILADIYSTVAPSAPYIIAAYVLLWAVLFVFVFATMRSVKKAEEQIQLLEEAIEDSKSIEEDPNR